MPKTKAVAPASSNGAPAAQAVGIDKVAGIIQERCTGCHSATPNAQFGFSAAPLGLKLDTPAEMIAASDQIKLRVGNSTMPMGNVTHMTDAERIIIAQWLVNK